MTVVALSLGLLASAAHASPPPAACPTRLTDPPVCESGSVLGTTAQTPYEWGPAASGAQLWWGRLACSGGRMAQVRRIGNAGGLAEPSTSVGSGMPSLGSDVVDQWEIGCPEARYRLYTNVYRCGRACLPATLQVLPANAMTHLDAAEAAARSGSTQVALVEARAVTDSAPEHERAWVFRGNVVEALGQWDEALTVWTATLARFPGGISESHRAEALARTGRLDEARALAATLLGEAPDAPTRPRLLCVSAIVEVNASKARTLASQACAEGYRRCCAP